MRANAFTSIVGGNDGEWLELCYDKNDSASDSFTIMALYKFTYLLTYLLTAVVQTSIATRPTRVTD